MPKTKKKTAETPCRLVVTYVDGSCSDNLAAERCCLAQENDGLVLTIEVAPRVRPGKVRAAHRAFRDFTEKMRGVHTIQIGKQRLVSELRGPIRESETSEIGVNLSARNASALYPAAVVFGPDELTLQLG